MYLYMCCTEYLPRMKIPSTMNSIFTLDSRDENDDLASITKLMAVVVPKRDPKALIPWN